MAKALITGASQGIGACIAKRLAKDGFDVVINHYPSDSDKEKALAVAEECRSFGVKAECYAADVSKFDQCEAMVKQVKADFGTIDALVNNAGITKDGLFVRMKEEDFDAVISVNLKGTYNFFREVVPVMSKQKYGRIVSISSIVGLQGNACQVNYSASKAGVIGITKSAAREYAGKNITCNAIAPGFVQTPMTDVLPEKVKEQMLAGIPLKRYGQVEDIANAVGFLVSDEASYITGQVLSVDGGMHM